MAPADAVRTAMSVIERLDAEIGAFVCVDHGAADDAEETVARLEVGPLRGMPVGVKDLFHVDGLPTRAGSQLPAQLFEAPESVVVARLRAAGACILGKTAMDEFAYAEPPRTKNPRDQRRTPGGSSGGS